MIHNLAWFDNSKTNESYGLVVFQLQQIVISEEFQIKMTVIVIFGLRSSYKIENLYVFG